MCEDDLDILFLVDLLLSQAGHEVVGVGTVAAAMAELVGDGYDLVVTDLGLPDASGVQVCEYACSAGTRVIVITANEGLGRLPEVRACAETVIAKPFGPQQLLDAVAVP